MSYNKDKDCYETSQVTISGMHRSHAPASLFVCRLDAVRRRSVLRRSLRTCTSGAVRSAAAEPLVGYRPDLLSGVERTRIRSQQAGSSTTVQSRTATATTECATAAVSVGPAPRSQHHIRQRWRRQQRNNTEPTGRRRRRATLKKAQQPFGCRAFVVL